MKKIIIILIVSVITALLVPLNSLAQATINNIKITPDFNTGLIKIEGNIENPQIKQNVNIIVKKEIDLPVTITEDNISSYVYAVKQLTLSDVVPGASYSLDTAVNFEPNIVGGWFTVMIGGKGLTATQTPTRFYFATDKELNVLYTLLSSNDTTKVQNTLETYASNIWKFEPKNYDYYTNNKSDVLPIFIAERADLGALSSIYTVCQTLYNSVAIAQVNKSNNVDGALGLLKDNYTNLSLGNVDIYNDFKNNEGTQKNVARLLNEGKKGYLSSKNLKEDLKTFIAIGAINNTLRGDMPKVIKNYNDILHLNLTEDYEKLDAIEVCKVLVDRDFKSIPEISTAFEDRIKELLKATINLTNSVTSGRQSKNITINAGKIALPEIPVIPNLPDNSENHTSFIDLDDVSWAKECVQKLFEKKIINGIGNNLFAPLQEVTREQFMKMLIVAFDLKPASQNLEYADVDKNMWYYPYMQAAYYNNLIKGINEQRMGIGMSITRQDMAVILNRMITIINRNEPSAEIGQDFSDINEASLYAIQSIRNLQHFNIINGLEGHRFAPHKSLTRAETAMVLFKFINKFKVEE